MYYASIDIETTGVMPACDIIEVGIVIDNLMNQQPVEKLPTLRILFKHKNSISENYAMNMHAKSGLLEEILNSEEYLDDFKLLESGLATRREDPYFKMVVDQTCEYDHDHYDQAQKMINAFLEAYTEPGKKLVVAGKNVAGFDIPRLKYHSLVDDNQFSHRTIDVGSLYIQEFFDAQIRQNTDLDKTNSNLTLPSLKDCMWYAGFNNEVSHMAVEDARDVVRLVRYKFNEYQDCEDVDLDIGDVAER